MRKRTAQSIDNIIENFLAQMPNRNQTKAAKTLNIRKQDFNNYYLGLYKPREELLIEMEDFLALRGISLSDNKNAKSQRDCPELSILERAEQAKAFMEGVPESRGRKSAQNHEKKVLIRKTFCELTGKYYEEGRLDTFTAKNFGFGNATTLRQILTLNESASPPLRKAINDDRLEIEDAYELMSFSSSEQQIVLDMEDHLIEAYFKALKKRRRKEREAQKLCKFIEKSSFLMQLENQINLQVRKRLIEEVLACIRNK